MTIFFARVLCPIRCGITIIGSRGTLSLECRVVQAERGGWSFEEREWWPEGRDRSTKSTGELSVNYRCRYRVVWNFQVVQILYILYDASRHENKNCENFTVWSFNNFKFWMGDRNMWKQWWRDGVLPTLPAFERPSRPRRLLSASLSTVAITRLWEVWCIECSTLGCRTWSSRNFPRAFWSKAMMWHTCPEVFHC